MLSAVVQFREVWHSSALLLSRLMSHQNHQSRYNLQNLLSIYSERGKNKIGLLSCPALQSTGTLVWWPREHSPNIILQSEDHSQ